MTNYIIITIFIFFFILFLSFLVLLKGKIDGFELKIIEKFKEKNNQIPSIYDVTDSYLNKHDIIFTEILRLKKKDFSENAYYHKLLEKVNIYKLIHNELNFIFRVCNKHPKLNKNGKYLYIRDNIIDKSASLGEDIDKYKKIVKKYNNLINIKNYTIIGLLFPIHKKISI